MQVSFRELTISDIDSCLSVMKQNYTKEHEKFWEDILSKDLSDILNKAYPSKCLVVILGETIIGFGCYLKVPESSTQGDGIFKLTWLNIIPKEQGKGIGKKLVKELEKNIRKEYKKGFYIILETDKPYFYKKLGYEIYNKNGHNDIMKKFFPTI